MRACLLTIIALYPSSAAPANKTTLFSEKNPANKADVTPRSSCTCSAANPTCDSDGSCRDSDGWRPTLSGCGSSNYFSDSCSTSYDADGPSPPTSSGCTCDITYPNCVNGQCYKDSSVGGTADLGGCGGSIYGETCTESHQDGEVAKAEEAAENIGIIIAYVAGGLVAAAILTCLIKYFCEKNK